MGNPKRYTLQDKHISVIVYPDMETKTLTIVGDDLLDFYETAKIEFYSAPDVITQYSNGNTCKDEWRRYWRWEFKNLTKIENGWAPEYSCYKFDECKDIVFQSGDPEMETNIPMGKFAGMTYQEVQNYKRKNQVFYKGQFPKPSKEAVEAAFKTQNVLSIEDVEKMLIEAYKIDI